MILTRRSERIQQAETRCSRELWPHQLATIHRCMTLERKGPVYGTLCDAPGTGKTHAVLGLVATSSGKGLTVITVPHNIFSQWQTALADFELKALTVVQYADICSLFWDKPFGRDFSPRLEGVDLILATDVCFDPLANSLQEVGIKVSRLVFDEADTIRYCVRSLGDARHTWLVTASWSENDDGTWKGLRSGRLDRVQCDPNFIASSITLPMPVYSTTVCRSLHTDAVLRYVLDGEDLEAVNALDYARIVSRHNPRAVTSDVDAIDVLLKDAVGDTELLEERLRSCLAALQRRDITPRDVEVYEAERKEVTSALETARRTADNIRARLREAEMCLICYDALLDVGTRVMTNCCQNTFCVDCAKDWWRGSAKKSCPVCRERRGFEDLVIRLGEKDPASENTSGVAEVREEEEERPTKIEALMRIVGGRPEGAKMIVFSSFTGVFAEARRRIMASGATVCELDGGTIEAIDQGVREYKEGAADVLLSSATLFGCGLNLENTTDVVFLHRMPHAQRAQVIGRAQRPGRIGALRVHDLLHENEELIRREWQ